MLHALHTITASLVGFVLFAHTLASASFLFVIWSDNEIRIVDRAFWYAMLAYLGVAMLATFGIFAYIAVAV